MSATRRKADVKCKNSNESIMSKETPADAPSHPFVRCCQCNEEFKLYKHLQEHMKQTGHSKPFVCELCDRSFYTQGGLDRHSREKHESDMKQEERSESVEWKSTDNSAKPSEKRSTCPKKFFWASKFTQRRDRLEEEEPFVCDTCGIAFKRSCHLKEHLVGAHRSADKNVGVSSSRKFTCSICNQAYFFRGSLASHMKRHIAITQLKCDVCAVFKSPMRTKRKQPKKTPVTSVCAGHDSTAGEEAKQEETERSQKEPKQHPDVTSTVDRQRLAEPVDDIGAVEVSSVKLEEAGTWHVMQSYEFHCAIDTDALVHDIIDGIKREIKQESDE